MKAVGIKALKNNLSYYLQLVRQGVIVVITDRDEVIAEIHQPLLARAGVLSPWQAYISSQTQQRKIVPAQRRKSAISKTKTKDKTPIDWKAIYQDVRSDR